MTTASVAQGRSPDVGSLTRPSIVSIGTIVWLSSELMFFAALFAMYFTVRGQLVGEGEWPPGDVELSIPYALPFTVILVLSSLTCQFGVFAAERGDVFGLRRWFAVTLLLGTFFVMGQGYEYINLVREGLTISSSAYGSIFFLATGFHGLHVMGGLVAFLVVLGRSAYGRFTPDQATSAIVTSYYWHFVDVVWIALFLAIYVIR